MEYRAEGSGMEIHEILRFYLSGLFFISLVIFPLLYLLDILFSTKFLAAETMPSLATFLGFGGFLVGFAVNSFRLQKYVPGYKNLIERFNRQLNEMFANAPEVEGMPGFHTTVLGLMHKYAKEAPINTILWLRGYWLASSNVFIFGGASCILVSIVTFTIYIKTGSIFFIGIILIPALFAITLKMKKLALDYMKATNRMQYLEISKYRSQINRDMKRILNAKL